MIKLPINPFLLLISRRSYKAASETGSVRLQTAASDASADAETAMTRRTATAELGSGNIRVNNVATKYDVEFWMRDPKTQNWIPESHFGEVDVADLREKLLPNNKHKL